MKNYLLLTTLLGTMAVVGHNIPVLALSPVEVQRIAKQTTVKIVGQKDRSSGVIIQKNGNTYTVLTVAHAVNDRESEIVTPDDTKHQITRIVTFPGQVDLAVVVFTSFKNYQVAKLIDKSERVEAGETIYVSGFPISSAIDKSVFTFVKGDVISNSNKQQGKGYSLIYNNNTLPGHSGGPVWNDRGELIAIHGQGDIDSKSKPTMNSNVRIKTGYNLGITIDTFTKLALVAGVSGYKPVTETTKPKPVDDLIASAVLKNSKGDHQGTIADMDRALALDPDNAQLYSIRGVAKSEVGNPLGAIEDLDRAIALDPQDAKAYNNRGNAKSDLGDNQGALADYDRAIALNPKLAQSYAGRGVARSRLGDNQGAIANYNRAIDLNPDYAEAYHGRGNAKYMSGDKNGSIDDARKAAELYKQQGQTRNYKKLVKAIEKLIPSDFDVPDYNF